MSCCVEMRTDCGAHCCDQIDAAVPIRSNSRAAGRVTGPGSATSPHSVLWSTHHSYAGGGEGGDVGDAAVEVSWDAEPSLITNSSFSVAAFAINSSLSLSLLFFVSFCFTNCSR